MSCSLIRSGLCSLPPLGRLWQSNARLLCAALCAKGDSKNTAARPLMSGWYPPPYAFGTPKMREEVVTTAQPSCESCESASAHPTKRPARRFLTKRSLSARVAELSQPRMCAVVPAAAAEPSEPKKTKKIKKKIKKVKKVKTSCSLDELLGSEAVEPPVLRCLPSGGVATNVVAMRAETDQLSVAASAPGASREDTPGAGQPSVAAPASEAIQPSIAAATSIDAQLSVAAATCRARQSSVNSVISRARQSSVDTTTSRARQSSVDTATPRARQPSVASAPAVGLAKAATATPRPSKATKAARSSVATATPAVSFASIAASVTAAAALHAKPTGSAAANASATAGVGGGTGRRVSIGGGQATAERARVRAKKSAKGKEGAEAEPAAPQPVDPHLVREMHALAWLEAPTRSRAATYDVPALPWGAVSTRGAASSRAQTADDEVGRHHEMLPDERRVSARAEPRVFAPEPIDVTAGLRSAVVAAAPPHAEPQRAASAPPPMETLHRKPTRPRAGAALANADAHVVAARAPDVDGGARAGATEDPAAALLAERRAAATARIAAAERERIAMADRALASAAARHASSRAESLRATSMAAADNATTTAAAPAQSSYASASCAAGVVDAAAAPAPSVATAATPPGAATGLATRVPACDDPLRARVEAFEALEALRPSQSGQPCQPCQPSQPAAGEALALEVAPSHEAQPVRRLLELATLPPAPVEAPPQPQPMQPTQTAPQPSPQPPRPPPPPVLPEAQAPLPQMQLPNAAPARSAAPAMAQPPAAAQAQASPPPPTPSSESEPHSLPRSRVSPTAAPSASPPTSWSEPQPPPRATPPPRSPTESERPPLQTAPPAAAEAPPAEAPPGMPKYDSLARAAADYSGRIAQPEPPKLRAWPQPPPDEVPNDELPEIPPLSPIDKLRQQQQQQQHSAPPPQQQQQPPASLPQPLAAQLAHCDQLMSGAVASSLWPMDAAALAEFAAVTHSPMHPAAVRALLVDTTNMPLA